MILWRRTIGVGLGLVVASSLWTVAQASPGQEDVVGSPILIQIDEMPSADTADSLTTAESLTEIMTVSSEDLTDIVAVATATTEVALVPTAVLENLSEGQIEAIATILSTAEESANSTLIAGLPAEVLTHLDILPGVAQPVARRRWLPNALVRRLRLPQVIASLIRQSKNTALVMLGNHIVVVNPVTGAVLGAVLSAL